ncbi:MAG: amidohydrolase family protein, partial [Planctomycetota bacterium]|nr:amidohydrolase family protein [Planctomycetota bacterium]
KAGKPVCVHLTESEFPYGVLLDRLDGGDILCHCFQGRGEHTILGANGRIGAAALRARERGVLFDAAVGRVNCDFKVAAAALADLFLPDIVSTDLVGTSVYNHKLFHLLYVMSAFLALGMTLPEVVRACTAIPAARMGMSGRIGTLVPGAQADVAIIRLRERPLRFSDGKGNGIEGSQLLVPLATLKSGRLVYKRIDFEY